MKTHSAAALSQLALVIGVWAQNVRTTIDLWSAEGCSDNLGDFETQIMSLDVTEDFVTEGEESESCMRESFSHPDWPTVGGADRYAAWVDQTTIESGCQLLLHTVSDSGGADSQYACTSRYVSVGASGRCASIQLPSKFGYKYCCGEEACGANAVNDLFNPDSSMAKKRGELPPHVEQLFQNDERNIQVVRDVTMPKRAAPLERLAKRDCSFSAKSSEPTTKYPGQFRIAPFAACNKPDGCEGSVTLEYSESTSNTFEASASVGGELFKAIGLEVSFGYSYEETEGTSFTYDVSYSVSNGARGYVAWEPVLSCATGSFSGDCPDWKTDEEGEACFVRMIGGGIPDGEYKTVEEHS